MVDSRQLLSNILVNDFPAFLARSFHELHPSRNFANNWHLDAMAALLRRMDEGEIPRSLITMPPRTLKSFTVSVAWVGFLLGKNPATKIIVVSYSEKLAEELSIATRKLMESSFYRGLFPKTVLDKSTSLHFTTTQFGMRLATSIGGANTGFGADWIIIDDPHNATEIGSQAAREEVKTFYQNTLNSRYIDPGNCKVLLVMQRLHPEDLAGHVLSSGGWFHLNLQAIATEDAFIDVGLPAPRQIKIGDLLHPERLSAEVLDQLRRDMGPANFSAQYLQEPEPASGTMFLRSSIKYCGRPQLHTGQVFISLDTAVKINPQNDYSACTIWLQRDKDHYLLETWRKKVLYPDLKQQILSLLNRYPGARLMVEDQGSGSVLIQELVNKGYPVIPCRSQNSKEVRASAATDYFISGLVHFCDDADGLFDFEGELFRFPNSKHDDFVDTVSQYFGWVRAQGSSSSMTWSWMGSDDTDPTHDQIAAYLLDRKWRRR
jgi:predicted phage terminase large subunit-like protein